MVTKVTSNVIDPTAVTAAAVGLGSVNNTADTAKPVSTAQQTALDLKANLASPTFTGTVAGVTKAMVGLGSVDNTADAAKNVLYAASSGTSGAVVTSNAYTMASLTVNGNVTMAAATAAAHAVRLDQLAGAFPAIASAATIDIFAISGASVSISGTTTVTAITACTAAQVGSIKTIIPSNAAGFSITATANIVVDGATSGTYLMPLNANIQIIATSTTTFKITTIFASGTWTPTVGGSATYFMQSGVWTKAGNLVQVDWVLVLTAIGTGSTTTLSGLPFTSANNTQISKGVTSGANVATAVVSENCYVTSNTTNILFEGRTAAAVAVSTLIYFGATTASRGSVSYRVS